MAIVVPYESEDLAPGLAPRADGPGQYGTHRYAMTLRACTNPLITVHTYLIHMPPCMHERLTGHVWLLKGGYSTTPPAHTAPLSHTLPNTHAAGHRRLVDQHLRVAVGGLIRHNASCTHPPLIHTPVNTHACPRVQERLVGQHLRVAVGGLLRQ